MHSDALDAAIVPEAEAPAETLEEATENTEH